MFGRPTLMYAVGRNCRQPETAARLINFLLTDVDAARLLGRTRGLRRPRATLAALLQADAATAAAGTAGARAAAAVEGRWPHRPARRRLFEHARLHKFMREVFETVAYGKANASRGRRAPGQGRQRAAQAHPVNTPMSQAHRPPVPFTSAPGPRHRRPRHPADAARRDLPPQLLLPKVLHATTARSCCSPVSSAPPRVRTGTTTCWTCRARPRCN
jgi:hypothetical protein